MATHAKRKKDHISRVHHVTTEMKKEKRKKTEKELDKTLENTFPASDATAKY